jgi:predicted MFS family arabinose efflux permease
LLVNYLGPQGVFAVSALIGIVAAIYSVLLIPRVHVVLPREIGDDNVGLVEGLKRVLTNREFLHTMFCVGVPAKAILTGAITFGLPLLLGQQGYRAEDIGQVIMLYAISVVAANMFISRIIDQTGRTVGILFAGTAISGGGLCLLGLMNSPTAGLGSAMVIIAGVVAIGIAHGFINAPVVTHVAHSEISNELGANSVTTTYRFLERVGHVIGPMLIAQCFLIWGESAQIFVGIGITTAILGLLFLMTSSAPRERTLRLEGAR